MSAPESFRNRFAHRLSVVAIVIYVIALLAWVAIVSRWLPMPENAMEMQIADPGVPEMIALTNGMMGVGLYLLMWGVMMVAMMYPSSVPFFRLYYKTLKGVSNTGKVARFGTALGTYVLVWTLTGLVPLLLNMVVPVAPLVKTHNGLLWGGTLLILGGYQLSPFKYRCLRYCRSPLGFLMSHHRPGIRGAIRMSWQYSIFCIGCCWALFAFMVVVGSMNIVWMALITVVLSLERTVAWGRQLAQMVGILAGIAGIAIIMITLTSSSAWNANLFNEFAVLV